jgi:hypothetical protein
MAKTPIWSEVCTHIVNALRGSALFSGAQVEDGWISENGVTSDTVVIVDDEIDSDTAIPVAVGGPKPYDDVFEINIIIAVRGRGSRAEARTRLAELDGAVHELLAGDPSLAGIDGVLKASIVRRTRRIAMAQDGPMARSVITVQVHSRLSPF